MPFGTLSRNNPGIHILDGGADVPTGIGTFRGVYGPLQSIGFSGMGKGWAAQKWLDQSP